MSDAAFASLTIGRGQIKYISRIPLSMLQDDELIELSDIHDLMSDTAGMSETMAQCVHELCDRLFLV